MHTLSSYNEKDAVALDVRWIWNYNSRAAVSFSLPLHFLLVQYLAFSVVFNTDIAMDHDQRSTIDLQPFNLSVPLT